MSYTMEALAAQAKAIQEEELAAQRPTRKFSRIPLADQLATANNQRRAQAWYDGNIAPFRIMLEELQGKDLEVLLYKETGALEAQEQDKTHRENKMNLQIILKRRFTQLKTIREQYLKDGLSTVAFKAAFGAICGRLEAMPGVKLDEDRRLIFDSVTWAHYVSVITEIQAEIDAEAEKTPGSEEPSAHTTKVDTSAESNPDRKIGDDSEKDTDALLADEFLEIDKLAQKAAKRKAAKAKKERAA